MSAFPTVVLIPAYHPDEKLLQLLDRLAGEFSLCVVDDGSGEAYADVFARARDRATVWQYPQNRGKGHALKYGFARVKECFPEARFVITADADGQHRPEDIRLVEQALLAGTGEEVVLGSRELKGKIPLRSRFGNGVTRRVFRLAAGASVWDTQTGLRGFPIGLLDRLSAITGDRYEYEMRMLIRLAEEGVPLREVRIETVYLEQNASSHFHPIRDSARIYRAIASESCRVKFVCSSLLSFCVSYLLTLVLHGLLGKSVFSMRVASTVAWVVSSQVNFWLNRRFAFRSAGRLSRELLQYYALAAVNYGIKVYVLQELLYSRLEIALWIVVPIAELLLYIMNYLAERYWVFRRQKGE